MIHTVALLISFVILKVNLRARRVENKKLAAHVNVLEEAQLEINNELD